MACVSTGNFNCFSVIFFNKVSRVKFKIQPQNTFFRLPLFFPVSETDLCERKILPQICYYKNRKFKVTSDPQS